MFEHLAKRDFDWKDVHIFWVDERCVRPDHADSNHRMTREALLAPIGLLSEQVHRIEGELSSELAVGRYVSGIREFFGLAPEELPRFDVIHLGMGSDAHTASLFPGESLIFERKHVAAAVYSAARDSHRITLLPGVLLNAAETFFRPQDFTRTYVRIAARSGSLHGIPWLRSACHFQFTTCSCT